MKDTFYFYAAGWIMVLMIALLLFTPLDRVLRWLFEPFFRRN